MMSVWEAAWVIARRDFVATVYSRSFVLFLLAPVVILVFALATGYLTEESERIAAQPTVAVVADGETAQALEAARQQLTDGTSEHSFPVLRHVQPAENLGVQARRLLADEEGNYSAVFSGTLDRPTLTGPEKIDEFVGRRMNLVVEQARRAAALDTAGVRVPDVAVQRVMTDEAVGNLRFLRRLIAQGGQGLIFMVTIMLATLLLSNLVEEKSNKVIEVLSAAVPLDAVFLGKMVAMLGISLVGLALWAGVIATAYLFFQVLQDWMVMPPASPGVGWPVYILLLFLYYGMNYMLLGSLFLGIGGQASNIREIQTLSMPITLLQLMVLLLAMMVVGREQGALTWFAYILPFSSPLAMIAFAAESPLLWPHLLALAWQAFWVFVIIRLSARWFRSTVLKSGSSGGFFSLSGWRRARAK